MYSFEDEKTASEWNKLVNEIKGRIATINYMVQTEEERNQSYLGWLQFVEQFRCRFGDEKVPLDIMSAVNSVQDGCNIEKTAWNAVKKV